jgi:uncharacterized membrane protein HdeD (DUF308 family)
VLDIMAERWWAVLLRGLAAIVFGVLAVVWPGITVLALVVLYGAYALVDGIGHLIVGFGRKGLTGPNRALLAVLGLLGVAAAVVAFVWPGITALVLTIVIGSWAIVSGVMEVVAAIRLRREITGEWAMVLSGTLSVVLGVILVLQPGEGALALALVIGFFAIAWGVALTILAFRLRGLRSAGRPTEQPVTG